MKCKDVVRDFRGVTAAAALQKLADIMADQPLDAPALCGELSVLIEAVQHHEARLTALESKQPREQQ